MVLEVKAKYADGSTKLVRLVTPANIIGMNNDAQAWLLKNSNHKDLVGAVELSVWNTHLVPTLNELRLQERLSMGAGGEDDKG